MSKLPLVPIFSAAHISKWDTVPELTLGSGFGLDDSSVHVKEQPNDANCESGTNFGIPSVPSVAAANKSHVKMTIKTYTWVTLWFLLTAPVVVWDASYCFFRPRSMFGGDLHWIWEPYGLYQNIDYVYGTKALEENNGFTNAQSLLNLLETLLNLTYVYLANVSSWSGAPLVGFAAALMTFSKTALYWAQEYFCGGCAVGHNAWGDLLLYWVLPNGLWLVFPGMIICRLGSDLLGALSEMSQSARKASSGKTL